MKPSVSGPPGILPPEVSQNDEVAILGSRLADVMTREEGLEIRQQAAKDPSARIYLESARLHAADEVDNLRDMIAATPATSLAGAAVQIAEALARCDRIRGNEGPHDEDERAIKRLLFSALGVVVDAAQRYRDRLLAPLGAFGKQLGKNFAPMVDVSVGNDAQWEVGDNRMPTIARTGLTALIDTGSDVSRIDAAILQNLSVQRVGDVSSNFTGVPANTSFFAPIQIVFPGHSFVAGGAMSATDMRANGLYFDVLIGWDILSYFSLYISAKGRAVELTYMGS